MEFTNRNKRLGMTLIELMIAVAIVGILAAVAIPSYISYLRRSYLSEATTSISAIKSAEESFYSLNNCYVEAAGHPASIPSATTVAWDPVSSSSAWRQNVLGVRPDRRVRFQYLVYASNSLSGGGCGGSPTALPTNIGCATNVADNLVNSVVFGSNWYVVVARGDLDGDSVASNIISAIDDSAIIMCNELE